jgi:hypothetical protein
MDANLVLSMPSALAPSHRWEVSLGLSEDRLDETWTYCADGFKPVSGTWSERFPSRADALRRLDARSEELTRAAARRAEALGLADASEDAARLADLLGATVPGMGPWSAAWWAQVRALSAWWDPSVWMAGALTASALVSGSLSDVLKRLRRAPADR